MLLLLPICFCFVLGKLHSVSFCKNQANVIVAFKFTSRDLDDSLNIDNHSFEQMASHIKFVTGLQIF